MKLHAFLFLFIIIQLPGYLFAQDAGTSIIYGKVLDSVTKAPVPYATVSIYNTNATLVASSITEESGLFKLEKLPKGGFLLTVSYMGYQSIRKAVNITDGTQNAGGLMLTQDPAMLKEVVVNGDKPAVSFKLDKKVFEVGKDILAQSGSANDILNSVPSVSVSPSGGISLRGNNNVYVMINGRRSGLTQNDALDQIPAAQIERIEVITNPSSRYDAAGSAGIINIVLKKNKKSGFNGQVRLVGGSPNDSRINPSLNYKSEKINIFSTFGIRKSDYVGLYTTNQQTIVSGQKSFLDQVQHEKRHDDGKLLYMGADYLINDKNTITAAFLLNATRDHDRTNLDYNYSKATGVKDSVLSRSGESWEKRNYNQVEFNYTKLFTRPGKKFTVDMQYDFWNSDKDWQLATQKTEPTATLFPGIRTSSIGSSKDLLVQSDLVQPFSKDGIVEFGLKLENRKVTTDYQAEQEVNGGWRIYQNIDNQLTYNELIGAAYAQLGNKVGKFGYQLGLRTELTRIRIADASNMFNTEKDYTRLFPTVNMSYAITTGATAQLNYSRRINRPSLNSLYPFNEITDFNAQYVGNPDLNPSYAHVVELGFIRNWSKLTFNPAVYYQYNKGYIQDYTFRNSSGIFITSPINIISEIRRGVELSMLYSPMKWLQVNAEGNWYDFKQQGLFQGRDLDYTGQILTARLNAQVKFTGGFGLQGRYNFNSAQSNAQSRTAAIHFADFGISKNLFNNKSTLVFDVTNVFNSRKFNTQTTGENYVLNQMNNPNAARYRLSYVYRFNLKDAKEVRQAKTGNRN
ncbi:TonB-dependent receptor domain-containing protein [Pedobacter duraquae]|uniref:Outer membrane receptor protein involved in Fe transport n=1 Tax=Pedobacter duraquae TaxID=425511 RepID=A0A4V3C442_9SPHI|nr:outer membrane beta-barrel family protein [Pedobacter duraquae]TDO24448.1 outer membrane receptor protein involved in Fe transport [Pedobacter duraquae]